MTETPCAVAIHGLALPPVLGWQVAAYADTCPAGLRPAGAAPVALWRDVCGAGRVRTLGADLLGLRLRLVVERLAPDSTAEWGLIR